MADALASQLQNTALGYVYTEISNRLSLDIRLIGFLGEETRKHNRSRLWILLQKMLDHRPRYVYFTPFCRCVCACVRVLTES